MKATTYIKDIGTITYDESFFSGKKNLYVNDVPCEKLDKKQYLYTDKEGNKKRFKLKGNFAIGVMVEINEQTYTIIEKTKWYELILCLLPFIFTVVWGNNVSLCKIFPVFGGAVGGAIGAAFGICTLYATRVVKPIWLKILIGLGIFALSIIINNLLAVAFLIALA